MLNLALGRFSQRDGFDEFKHRFKFALRSMLTLPLTLRWLKTFTQNEDLLAYLHRLPRLASKLHRPYLYQTLATRGKLKILQQHYQLECSRFAPRPLSTLLNGATLTLATIDGKDQQCYRMTLTHQQAFDKEGELSLCMLDQADVALVTLTFSLCNAERGASLIIGGLQGPRRNEDGLGSIKLATKACHGLFPKRVAMEALTALAEQLNIRNIRAVSNRQHIYNSLRYRKEFESDYDSFWLALDATLNQQMLFELPLQLPRKSPDQLASKKRAEYARRYQMLDQLRQDLALTLS
jgi:uncharacterized protein VirK/YbjX